MNRSSIPRYLAVHPSWTYEASRLANDHKLLKELKEEAWKIYMSTAPKLATFNSDDVYQIDDNTFFSYGDGLKYKVASTGERVALIEMKGIMFSSHWYNDYDYLIKNIQKAENPAYSGALILANSPGGSTEGMRRLYKTIEKYSKPIGTYVSGYLASAAAYVTAPSSFIVADPYEKNVFGSVGVFCVLENISEQLTEQKVKVAVIRNNDAIQKFKPNPYEPWTPDDLAAVQKDINVEALNFHTAIEHQRGLKPWQMDEIKKSGVFSTKDAITHGLVDKEDTLDNSVERVIDYHAGVFF